MAGHAPERWPVGSGIRIRVFFSFGSDDFSFIKAVFLEKYGEPTKSASIPVKNRMGAEFLNEELIWDGPNILLKLEKYSSTVTEGRASFTVKSYTLMKIKELEEAKKRAAEEF